VTFAAEVLESYWSGFSVFGAGDFSFRISFKKGFKIVLFSLWRRDPVLELQFLLSLFTRKLICVKASFSKSLLRVKSLLCVKKLAV
jgi:hypothetical protein